MKEAEDLLNKLKTIQLPNVSPLESGAANTIKEFYDTFVQRHMFTGESTLAIHRALIEYVNFPDAMFAIRKFFTATEECYDQLRRGWLTDTNQGYSFFYTDNFYPAYYAKMTLDSYNLNSFELLEAHKQRKFPSRFGLWTHQEKEKYAIKEGRDPGISKAGYKIAHIIALAKDAYEFCGRSYSLDNIVTTYFKRGNREDWKQKEDYWVRDNFDVSPEAKNFLIAHFLRFVDPLNYVLLPKKSCEDFGGLGISEYQPLLDYIRINMHKKYGKEYEKFLELIMAPKIGNVCENKVIDLHYGLNTETPASSKVVRIQKSSITSEKISDSLRDLRTMGASWFVSFEYYKFIDHKHNNWEATPSLSFKQSAYDRNKTNYELHYDWLEQISEMSSNRLSTNKIGLDGEQILEMVKVLLEHYKTHNLIQK